MKKYAPVLLAALVAALALASPIKVWSTGETVSVTDVNGNFAHIHNTMVGGHGPRLVDADVSSSAGIQLSKLADRQLLPRMWVDVATCSTSTCTLNGRYPAGSPGVTSVTRSATGTYTVNFTARVSAVNAVAVQSTTGSAFKTCSVTGRTTSSVSVGCIEVSSDAGVSGLSDDGFTLLLLDAQ